VFKKIIGNAKKIASILLSDDEFRVKEGAPVLSQDKQFALGVGAIGSEQRMGYVNTLELGDEKEVLIGGLAKAWEITDPQSAMETIGWLLHEGHRGYYDIAVRGSALKGQAQNDFILEAASEEIDAGKLAAFVENFQGAFGTLYQAEIARKPEEYQANILAWDVGRCVTVARMCFDAGYLTEDQAWEAIHAAAELAKPAYSSWKEFGRSFILGRAMWGGDTMMLDGLIEIYQALLENDNSPWKQTKFG